MSKVKVAFRYDNDHAFCRSFVCEEENVPKPGMQVRLLVCYGTLVSIEQRGFTSPEGMKYFVGYVKEDGKNF